MSKNRYGRIYHSNHSYINLRFPSVDARREFAEKFEKYHGEHDHDGEAPRFEDINAQEAGSSTYGSSKLHDAHSVTIDGYATYEIEEYHEDEKHTYHYRYKPPTCCVPPLISIDRKLVDSAALERHELSAIFRDMEDYQSFLSSVEKDGFIDNVIRLYEGQILDGWHRYCAAKELNLLRKLRFKQWHEDEHRDGDPKIFVLGRNLNRRHYSAAQRAQVFVAFNERFGHGGDRKSDESSRKDCDLKTQAELAAEAGVSERTISTAVAIEKEGQSEAVIRGEKTAGEVIKARDAATAKKRKKQVLKNMWDIRIQSSRDYVGDSDTDLNQYLSQDDLEKGFVKNNETYALAFVSGMKRIDAAAGSGFKGFVDSAFEVDEFGNAKVDISELEEEYRAIMTYAGDIRQWKRPDWSPDTNWILPLIEAKKKAKKPSENVTVEKHFDAEPEPEETVESLWAKITPAISAWKAARKGKGLGHASKTMFISAIKCFDNELSKNSETDVLLLKKLLDVVTEVHGPGYTFERYIKMQLDGASLWSDEDTDAELDADQSLDDRMERCRGDLIEVYQQAWTWEGLEIQLYAEEYGIAADVIVGMQREIAAEHPNPLENTMSEMESIEKFDARLKEFGAHEELVCDSLHFYYGIQRADLSETPQETLVEISDFIDGFIDKPLEEWPEWIRNQVPKRELMFVSIGISRDNDEFELVEFTDESSDEVWCKLDELPQELKDALFELAVKKIVEVESEKA